MAYQAIPPVGGSDPWVTQAQNFLKSKVPTLTRFDDVKVGVNPISAASGAVTGDATAVGAGITPANGTGRFFAASIYQTPKTTGFGIYFRAKMLGPTAARVSAIGITNSGITNSVQVCLDPTRDATNYVLSLVGGATTNVVGSLAADSAYHDIAITGDATTVAAYFDRVTVASTTTLTNLTDQAMYPFAFNTIAGEAIILRFVYGYITP